MSKKQVSSQWYVYYQGQIAYYKSQEAALVATDLIIASCENGIWDWQESRIYLSQLESETINSNLFDRRYSNKALTPGSSTGKFVIDIYVKNKEDWIARHGSELLQESILAGYDCDEGYLQERVALDYPGFTANSGTCKKVDTPNEKCLYACLPYEGSHCVSNNKDYYIAIDNFLGKYQLRKPIDLSAEILYLKPSIKPAQLSSAIETTDDIKEWAFEYGSNLLQESIVAGYDSTDRYLQERLAYEYPGFTINIGRYQKVNSPDEDCLYACIGYEKSYCSSNDRNYYITIDNFLGNYQLIKPIESLTIATDNLSFEQNKSGRFMSLINYVKGNDTPQQELVRFIVLLSINSVSVMIIIWLLSIILSD
jgi:hypothetical protein